MLYPELFKQLESVRWNMDKDIPWDRFDASRLSDEQAQTVKMNAITEWAALPATEMFLRDNRDDSDFSAFMSVWFFEEQKHSLVLMEYLRRFPRDTIQSRLPDPSWLEAWLDKQIQFDSVWENKVIERILHNMSLLMERSFASVQELNRYRKEMAAVLSARGLGPAPGAQP